MCWNGLHISRPGKHRYQTGIRWYPQPAIRNTKRRVIMLRGNRLMNQIKEKWIYDGVLKTLVFVL